MFMALTSCSTTRLVSNGVMIGTESYKGLWQKLNWLCLFDELIEFQNQLNPGFKIKFQQVLIWFTLVRIPKTYQ